MLLKIRQFWCWLNNWGHEYHLTFDKESTFQKCAYCDYRRPGWTPGPFRERKIENKKVVGIRKRA